MINKYLVPPGFRDSLNFDSYIEHQYKNHIIDFFKSNGFDLVKTPLVEYSRNLNKNSFSIKTQKKQNKLSIRNDITPQIVRVASSRLKNKKRPLKLCYYGEVVRKIGTILRPERQFQQVGAEIIGTDNYKADVEIISLAYESLKIIGIKDIVIEISAPFFLDKILKSLKNVTLKKNLKKLIQIRDLKNCLKLLENNKLLYDLRNLHQCSGPIKFKKSLIENLSKSLGFQEEIKRIIKISELIKLSKTDSMNIDLFEFQNDKYYQGIKFTFFAKDVRGEIARGGRYLLKYGNHSEQAIGFACFMDTIIRASSLKNKSRQILIPFNTPKKNKNFLISSGYNIFTTFDEVNDLKKQSIDFGFNYYYENMKVKKI